MTYSGQNPNTELLLWYPKCWHAVLLQVRCAIYRKYFQHSKAGVYSHDMWHWHAFAP